MQTHTQLHNHLLLVNQQTLEQHQLMHNNAFDQFSKNIAEFNDSAYELLYNNGNKKFKIIGGNHPNVKYAGKVIDNNNGSVLYDWSGKCLEVAFTGGFLAIRVTDTEKNYYNLFINGKHKGVLTMFGKDSLIVLANGLGKKKNIVMLQKRTDAEQGITTIHAFEIYAKGDLL